MCCAHAHRRTASCRKVSVRVFVRVCIICFVSCTGWKRADSLEEKAVFPAGQGN